MPRRILLRTLALLGLTAAAGVPAACVPHRWIYLRVPIEGPPGRAVVDVPLARLHEISDEFANDRLVFYDRGRQPRPFRLVDRDGDGAVDHARVLVEITDARDAAPTELTVLGVSDPTHLQPEAPPWPARTPRPDERVRLIFERAVLRR